MSFQTTELVHTDELRVTFLINQNPYYIVLMDKLCVLKHVFSQIAQLIQKKHKSYGILF
jgi:hypothetical protein